MNKLFAFVLIAAALGLSVVSTQAMPFLSNQTQDSLVVPVAGGCGIGFHRGPYGGCRANGYYGGPVVVAPPVYYGGPGYMSLLLALRSDQDLIRAEAEGSIGSADQTAAGWPATSLRQNLKTPFRFAISFCTEGEAGGLAIA